MAFIINRYTQKVYSSTAVILLNQEGTTNSGIEAAMTSLGYYNPRLEFENEIITLSSFDQAYRTLRELDFEIEYWQIGRFKTTESYPCNVVKMEYDETHPQIIDCEFSIQGVDKSTFKITKLGVGRTYDYLTGRSVPGDVSFKEGIYKYGAWIEGKGYRFKIDLIAEHFDENDKILIRLRDFESLASFYSNRIGIEPRAKGSSALNLTLAGGNPLKLADYLNQYCDVYVEQTLDIKNKIADNTLSFINQELMGIEDSLMAIEGAMQRFRSEKKVVNLNTEGIQVSSDLSELEKRIAEEETKVSYFYFLLDYLETNSDYSSIPTPAGVGINSDNLSSLLNVLANQYLQLTRFEANATSKNPAVVQLKKEIELTKANIKESVNNQIIASKEYKNSLVNRKAKIEAELRLIPKTEQELLNIQRKSRTE